MKIPLINMAKQYTKDSSFQNKSDISQRGFKVAIHDATVLPAIVPGSNIAHKYTCVACEWHSSP